ncbi:protein of unknown function [Burkholderia multivorans]
MRKLNEIARPLAASARARRAQSPEATAYLTPWPGSASGAGRTGTGIAGAALLSLGMLESSLAFIGITLKIESR